MGSKAADTVEEYGGRNNYSYSIRQLTTTWIENREPAAIYIGMLILLGVTGNITVLFIFTRLFRASTYRMFVRTLAIVDLLVCVTNMPLEIVYLLKPFGFYSEGSCKAYRYCVYCLNYLSIILISMIAIERYIQICWPLSKWRMSSKYAEKFAVIATVFAMVSAIPSVFTNGNHEVHVWNETLITCDTDDHNYKTSFVVSYFALVGLLYAVVTCLLIFTYSSIIRVFLKRDRILISDVSCDSNTTATNSEPTRNVRLHIHQNTRESHGHLIKTTRTLLIITLIFVIVHAPFFILCIVVGVDVSFRNSLNNIQAIVYEIGLRMYLINNVTNPIVYGLTDWRFKRACISIFKSLNCER